MENPRPRSTTNKPTTGAFITWLGQSTLWRNIECCQNLPNSNYKPPQTHIVQAKPAQTEAPAPSISETIQVNAFLDSWLCSVKNYEGADRHDFGNDMSLLSFGVPVELWPLTLFPFFLLPLHVPIPLLSCSWYCPNLMESLFLGHLESFLSSFSWWFVSMTCISQWSSLACTYE